MDTLVTTPLRNDESVEDCELVARVRQGDNQAYDALYRRHEAVAHRIAAYYVHQRADREDVVATAFTDVLQAVRNGGGPSENFRAYLLVAIRRLGGRWRSVEWVVPLDETGPIEDEDASIDPIIAAFERNTVAEAFSTLPERWQTVLWHAVVEGETPAQVAPVLGISSHAVSMLSHRAQEGLRKAFIAGHACAASDECEVSSEHLTKFLGGNLSEVADAKVEDHLASCESCSSRAGELRVVASELGAIRAESSSPLEVMEVPSGAC